MEPGNLFLANRVVYHQSIKYIPVQKLNRLTVTKPRFSNVLRSRQQCEDNEEESDIEEVKGGGDGDIQQGPT